MHHLNLQIGIIYTYWKFIWCKITNQFFHSFSKVVPIDYEVVRDLCVKNNANAFIFSLLLMATANATLFICDLEK